MTLLRLFVTISLRKVNEDDLNERDNYGMPFYEQQYTHGSCYISLFKCKFFDQSDPPPPPPRMASNFRHLLNCGTIASNNFISISYRKFLFNLITSFKFNLCVSLLRKKISGQRNMLTVSFKMVQVPEYGLCRPVL